MTPEEEIRRGAEADMILNHPLFKEALQHIDTTLAYRRDQVPPTAKDMHTALILAEQMWNQIKKYIQEVADSGKLGRLSLERERTLRQRAEGMVTKWRGRR